jgi:hypothetical protein
VTSAEKRLIAEYLCKYAAAVESSLYMHMKPETAHEEIQTSLNLANSLKCEAAALEDMQV